MKHKVNNQTGLRELEADVQGALQLLDQETADAIVGEEPGPEYGALIRGTQAVMGMLSGVLQQFGLRRNPAALRRQAQALTMLLTIVHYAYALGIRRGREDLPEAAPDVE